MLCIWITIHKVPLLFPVKMDYDACGQQACIVRRDLLTATQDPNSRYGTKQLGSKHLLRENALLLDIQATLYLSPYCFSERALPCFYPKTKPLPSQRDMKLDPKSIPTPASNAQNIVLLQNCQGGGCMILRELKCKCSGIPKKH